MDAEPSTDGRDDRRATKPRLVVDNPLPDRTDMPRRPPILILIPGSAQPTPTRRRSSEPPPAGDRSAVDA